MFVFCGFIAGLDTKSRRKIANIPEVTTKTASNEHLECSFSAVLLRV